MVRIIRNHSGSWTVIGRIFLATGLYFFLVAAKIERGVRSCAVERVESAKMSMGSGEEELKFEGKGVCLDVSRIEICVCEGM